MTKSALFCIVDDLLERNVQLVIIGGHAVNFHGYARATEDIEIIFRRSDASEQARMKTAAGRPQDLIDLERLP